MYGVARHIHPTQIGTADRAPPQGRRKRKKTTTKKKKKKKRSPRATTLGSNRTSSLGFLTLVLPMLTRRSALSCVGLASRGETDTVRRWAGLQQAAETIVSRAIRVVSGARERERERAPEC